MFLSNVQLANALVDSSSTPFSILISDNDVQFSNAFFLILFTWFGMFNFVIDWLSLNAPSAIAVTSLGISIYIYRF